MQFKNFSYRELWKHLCSVKSKHLCSFGPEHHEKHLEFGELVQEEMSFKDISYLELCFSVRRHNFPDRNFLDNGKLHWY